MAADILYACRLLRRSPRFAIVAIVTLALGIGANTAVFSILDASLLKPLPFRDPHQLVDIREVQGKGTAEERIVSGMTRARLQDWRAQTHIFAGIEADRGPRSVSVGDTQQTVRVAQISPGLFPLLGVAPSIGRGLTMGDGEDALLIGDGFWRRFFGEDPNVVGRQLMLDGRSHHVVGVMPAHGRYPLGAPVDAWSRLSDVVDPKDPSSAFVGVVARLRPGLTAASARSAVDAAAAAIQEARPGRRAWSADLDPIDPRAWLTGAQPVVLIAFGAVALLLFTACANVANLLLARTWGRQRELAIRHALGANQWRVMRLVMAESLMVSMSGGAAAILLAYWLIRAFPAIVPPRLISLPIHDATVDARVVAFAIASSVVVGISSGLIPSLRASRGGRSGSINTLAAQSSLALPPRRARNAFIAVQVSFAVILLTGAGLFTTSFVRMVSSDPGYDMDGLLAVSVELPPASNRAAAQQFAYFRDLANEVRALPDVIGVTFGVPPPEQRAGGFAAAQSLNDPAQRAPASLLWTGPDYFRVLGIEIVEGRAFAREESLGGERVAIVDEDAARRFWPGESPIGQRVRYSPYVPWFTIVGVARNVKTGRIGGAGDSFELYLPLTPADDSSRSTLLVRSTGEPERVVASVRTLSQTLDPRARVVSASLVETLYGPSLANPRFTAMMMSLFAALALLTAAVGLYGMLSYAVAVRAPEIGVRMALGATGGDVRRLVILDALAPVLVGAAIGLVASQWITRYIASQLYRVSASDPATLVLVISVFLAIALGSAYLPARRATRVDPVAALRAE